MQTDETHSAHSAFWRRRAAMMALGATLLAFPAGIAMGITGTVAWHAAMPAEEPAKPAPSPAASALNAPSQAQLDTVTAQATAMRDAWVAESSLSQACLRELRSIRPDGMTRAVRVIEAEKEKRARQESFQRDYKPLQ